MQLERSRIFIATGLVVIGAGIVFRLFNLEFAVLTQDEGYSVHFGLQSLSQQWGEAWKTGVHPPLYYSIVGGWIDLWGFSLAAIRLLSFGAIVLAILFACRSVNILTGRNGLNAGSVTTGLLLAASGPQIYWSLQARPYAILILAASAAIYSLLLYVARCGARDESRNPATGNQIPLLVLLGVSLALAMWMHNLAASLAAGIAIGALLWFVLPVSRPRPKDIILLAGAGILAFLLWLPQFITLFEQLGNYTGGFFYKNAVTAWMKLSGPEFLGLFLCYGLIAVGGLAWLGKNRNPGLAIVLGSILVVPFIVAFASNTAGIITFGYKAFAWIEIPAAILAGTAVYGYTSDKARMAIYSVLLIVVVGIFGASLDRRYLSGEQDWQANFDGLLDDPDQSPIVAYPNELDFFLRYNVRLRAPEKEQAFMNRVLFVPGDYPLPGLDRPYQVEVPSVIPEDSKMVFDWLADAPKFWLIYRGDENYDPGWCFQAELLRRYRPAETGDPVKLPLLTRREKKLAMPQGKCTNSAVVSGEASE